MDKVLRKLTHSAIALATGFVAIGPAFIAQQSASAAQQFLCTGTMDNGWAYTANFVDGRFTEIRWERSGQPPQTSTLTFSNTNAQGQPIYTGAFQAATAVTLLDLSGGNVGPGSQISVSVEEWGTSTGTCGLDAGTTPPPATQALFCEGQMTNGWAYTAEYANGRFTQIRWQRSGQPPQTSTLSLDARNAQGQPIYRGAFMAATSVTLVDLSGGNPQVGSEVSVGVEEWGWSRGRCRR